MSIVDTVIAAVTPPESQHKLDSRSMEDFERYRIGGGRRDETATRQVA